MHRWFTACWVIVGSVLLAPVQDDGRTGEPKPGITADELQSLLEKARAKHDVPAIAAGLIRGKEPAVIAVVGVRKRDTEVAATPADSWHLGSNTKPMTALLIALLIEAGLLDWDTPLDAIFPDEAEKWSAETKKITPAQLLTHTSGLPPSGPLLEFLLGHSEGSPSADRARIIRKLDTAKLNAKPGEKYAYSNLGYIVLGAIADRRGKASWEEQIEKKVLQPLGIKTWGLGPIGKKDAVDQPWPHQQRGKPVAADGVMDNSPVMNSAGRLHMPVGEYLRFLAETLRLARGEQGLLKRDTAAKLFTNPYPISPHSLSGCVGHRKEPAERGLILRHDGSNTFNYCSAVVECDANRAFGVFTNQGGPGGPGHKACAQLQNELGSPR
jgi:CubicO group peptidase (beta-lactamase class C family)